MAATARRAELLRISCDATIAFHKLSTTKMADLGHATHVANFITLISRCEGFGAAYNPSNPMIALSSLQASLAAAQAGIDGVTSSLAGWKTKVNIRENEYADVGKLATRVVSAFASSGATTNGVEDMRGFSRKIAGARRSKIKPDDPRRVENDATHNSASQRSYTYVAEHLDGMIELARDEPLYKPNETDLQIGALEARSISLKTVNQGVVDTLTGLAGERIARNNALYDEPTSIVNLARLVKEYVKSAFGPSSPEYKSISGITFKKRRS